MLADRFADINASVLKGEKKEQIRKMHCKFFIHTAQKFRHLLDC